jgi:hypothetical protein
MFVAALSLLAAGGASGETIVGHYSDCFDESYLRAVNPFTGEELFVTYAPNRGDILRRNPDGSAWAHLADGNARVEFRNALGFLLAEGTGSFSASSTVLPWDDSACSGFFFDGVRTNLHVTADMTSVLGDPFQLVVQAVVRDGEYILLNVEQR